MLTARRSLLVLALVLLPAGLLALRSARFGVAAASVQKDDAKPLSTTDLVRSSKAAPSRSDELAEAAEASESAISAAQAERDRIERERRDYFELKALPAPTDLQRGMMRAIEVSSRYPRANQSFARADSDPVTRAREPELRIKRSKDEHTMLAVSCDKKQYELGSVVTVFAMAAHDEGTAKPFDAGLTVRLEQQEPFKVLAELAMAKAPDGRFSAQFDLTKLKEGVRTGIYEVRVTARDGLSESVPFLVHPAYARLSGGYREHIENGALVVEAQLEVFEHGEYYAFASLYAGDDTPVGTVEIVRELEAGTHWIPLRFHGLLFHDAGRDGPYRLRHLQVSRRMIPAWEGVTADPEFQTAAYRLDQLSDEPYFRLDVEEEAP